MGRLLIAGLFLALHMGAVPVKASHLEAKPYTSLPCLVPARLNNRASLPDKACAASCGYARQARARVVARARATVTAYTSRVMETDRTPRITASGKRVRWGVVAANRYPFGTRLRFPELFGGQVFVVEDRTHPRYKNRLDIWMPSLRAARELGRRQTLVEVVGRG